jgi:cytochrome b561
LLSQERGLGGGILQRIVEDDISSAWLTYMKFAMLVVGISGGVRIFELERYITPQNPGCKEGNQILQLSSDRWIPGLLFAQPISGMAATILRGRPFDLFRIQWPALMAPYKAWAATAQGLHTLGAYALASLVLFHAGAAVLQRVIADDGVLDSMLPALRKGSGTLNQ